MATVILSELNTELQTDPLTLGYAPLIAAGDHSGLAAILNDVAGAGAASIDREFVDAATFQSQVDPTEYLALTVAQQNLWNAILTASTSTQVPLKNSTLRSQVLAVWAAGTTRTNLAALQTRTGSRAEVLWGDGAVVTHTMIAEALGV